MPITKVADRATVNTNTSTTTFDYPLSGMTIGNTLIIRVAADNTGGGGAARSVTVTNQSGTPIDTATDRTDSYNHDPGAAGAGITCHVVSARITAASGTVRLTYSGAVTQAGVAEEWSGIELTVVNAVSTDANSDSTTIGPLGSISRDAGNLLYAAIAVEGPGSDTYTGDSDTTNGTWVELTKAGTSTGTANTECTTYGGYKILTETGAQTFDGTINNARDQASQLIEFRFARSIRSRTPEAVRRSSIW